MTELNPLGHASPDRYLRESGLRFFSIAWYTGLTECTGMVDFLIWDVEREHFFIR